MPRMTQALSLATAALAPHIAGAPPCFAQQTDPTALERPLHPYVAPSRTPRLTAPAPRAWPRGFPVSVQINTSPDGMNILGDAANGPSIAVDPTNPLRMAVGWRQFDSISSDFRQAGYAYSRDGGRTWTFPGAVEPGVFRSNPVLRSDHTGTFYYNSFRFDASGQGVDLFTSLDHGATWGNRVDARSDAKAWMTIDTTDGPGQGNIYQVWSFNSFNRSFDGQTFFYRAVGASTNGTIAVGPDSEVLACDNDDVVIRSVNAHDPTAIPLFISRQVDLGDAPLINLPNPGGLLSQSWIDLDRSDGPRRGWAYYCGVRRTSDQANVRFASSPDGGLTWNTPVTINNDPPTEQNLQWFVTMNVAPNGRIDVVWNDTRNSHSPYQSQTFYAWSHDGGATWLGNIPIGPIWNSLHGFPVQQSIGAYYDLRSDLVGADLVYAATYNFNPDRSQGEQDIYYVRLGEHDCNMNGVGDETEISANLSLDCNANTILDSCELAAGLVTDVNGNGRPDSCDCLADWNSDGSIDSQDFFDFLALFLNSNADINADGSTNSQDFFDFLAIFFTGC